MHARIALTIFVIIAAWACKPGERPRAEPARTEPVASDPLLARSGCTADACRAVRACGIRFEAGPRTVMCLARLRLDALPASFDETPYCVAACRRMNAGAIADCVRRKPACTPDQQRSPEELGCAGSTGEPDADPECADRCEDAKRACDSACPATDLDACMRCGARCGEDWHACWTACPRTSGSGS